MDQQLHLLLMRPTGAEVVLMPMLITAPAVTATTCMVCVSSMDSACVRNLTLHTVIMQATTGLSLPTAEQILGQEDSACSADAGLLIATDCRLCVILDKLAQTAAGCAHTSTLHGMQRVHSVSDLSDSSHEVNSALQEEYVRVLPGSSANC